MNFLYFYKRFERYSVDKLMGLWFNRITHCPGAPLTRAVSTLKAKCFYDWGESYQQKNLTNLGKSVFVKYSDRFLVVNNNDKPVPDWHDGGFVLQKFPVKGL